MKNFIFHCIDLHIIKYNHHIWKSFRYTTSSNLIIKQIIIDFRTAESIEIIVENR